MAVRHLSRRNALRLVVGAGASAFALGKITPVAIAASDRRFVNTDLLNLREDASISAAIITTLPFGTEVAIDSSQRRAADGVNWIFVTVIEDSEQGWVDSSYLSLNGSEPSTGGSSETQWVSVADANLREGAGLSERVIKTLPLGQEVLVTGDGTDADGYTWYPVSVDDTNGWLADIVLTKERPATPGLEQGAAIEVTTDLLNLREEPGLSGSVIKAYGFGTTGKIVSDAPESADDISWYQVEIDEDGEVGWFAGQYIGASGGSGGSTSDTATVSDGPVNLRTSPSLQGEVLTRIETDATVTLIGSDFTAADGYQWINVRLSDQTGREGWIASEFVTFS